MMLTERGYHGTGLQDLLASVRIPKGSFYNYFASKEEFGAAVVAHYIEPFIQRLRHELARPDGDALAALERYFLQQINELEQRGFRGGCLLGNLLGEIGDTDDACFIALRDAVWRYRDELERALAEAQAVGTVRQDLPAASLADLLADAWQGALLRMKVERSVEPLRRCIASLLNDYFRPRPER